MEHQPKFKIRKKKLGSYPYVSVVLSMTLALFVIGIFGLLMIYSKELEKSVRENVRIQVFLKSNISETQRDQVHKNLSARYFINKKTTQETITFISKEEAAKEFIKETGEDFQNFLGENPLRDAFLVSVDPAYHDSKSLAKIKSEVEKLNGVFQVYYVENVIESINKNVTRIALILLSVSLILFITIVLLINNTLRLALFSQRFLIRSMQLVGAKHWFIKRPFIIRAMLHGMLSGALASGLLLFLIISANRRISDLKLLQNSEQIAMLLGTIVLLGIFVAMSSTYRTVSKYLKLSLDELF
ncbi:MAG: ABC transporter permease [Flammeovirgaceae bacterium]|nr:ABC transporter permease [Flammeovirgaceae bacterium]